MFPNWLKLASGFVCVALLSGCSQGEIKTYRVPKEAPVARVADNQQTTVSKTPSIDWKTPEGWEEQTPTRMRLASFVVPNETGPAGEVAVIPLPGMANLELQSVNLWRQELNLPRLDESELDVVSREVTIGEHEGLLVEFTGTNTQYNPNGASQILGGLTTHGGAMWFFKFWGPETLVRSQREQFTNFLASIAFHATSEETDILRTAPPSLRPTAPASPGRPTWDVPDHWEQAQPSSSMIMSRYVIGDSAGTSAEVTISTFPGDVGGPLMNVNRWRRQVGLPPIESGQLAAETTTLEIPSSNAFLVDLQGEDPSSGQPTRLVAAMVFRDNRTWVYKLMGDEVLVGNEKVPFVNFVKGVEYADAP